MPKSQKGLERVADLVRAEESGEAERRGGGGGREMGFERKSQT